MFKIKFSLIVEIMINFSGLTLTSGTCKLSKNGENLIGVSLGGGYPTCPCLYIVQIFDDSPASKDGSLAAGLLFCFP